MELMTCLTDGTSSVPLYRQIYDAFTADIRSGRRAEGERMPSKRRLAAHLGVSRNTVEAAYSQLAAEGYIRSQPRRGFFVCRIDTGFIHAAGKATPAYGERNTYGGHTDEQGKILDLSSRSVDMSAFPYSVLRTLYREAVGSKNSGILYRTGDPRGDGPFREAAASYLYDSRGVQCTADRIVIGAGTEYLLQLVGKLLGPQTIYGTENPGYRKTALILEDCGGSTVPVTTDGYGMSDTCLRRTDATAAYVTPAHQFPLGITMPVTRRTQLLQWAYERGNRFIIEDDYDSDYRYEGRPVPALQGLDTGGKVLYIGTFSRSLAPSMRISYLVLPPVLAREFGKRFAYYSCTVSRIDQYVLARFIMEGHFERHLNRMRRIYRQRRDTMISLLKQNIPGIRIYGEQAGLHFMAEIPSDLTEKAFTETAARKGLRLTGTESCLAPRQPEQEDYPYERNNCVRLIIGYAHLDEYQCARAADILKGIAGETGRKE